jgi:hypothetical protein
VTTDLRESLQALCAESAHADTCWLEVNPNADGASCTCWQADLRSLLAAQDVLPTAREAFDHFEAIADTGAGYNIRLRKGYVLECCWCDGPVLFMGATMGHALEKYRAHERQMGAIHYAHQELNP